MRHLALFSGVALALCAPLSVMADDTANLKVTGTISPASCGVSLASGSEVNLGTVRLSDFKPGEDLKLEAKTASLSIACNGGPAFFRLRASDATGGVSDGSAHYGGRGDRARPRHRAEHRRRVHVGEQIRPEVDRQRCWPGVGVRG